VGGRLTSKNPAALIPSGSLLSYLLEQVEEEELAEPADPYSTGKTASKWK